MCSVVVVVVVVVILYFLVVVVLLSRWEGKRADFFLIHLETWGAKSSHFFEYPLHPILGICCLDQVKLFHPDCHVS